MTVRDPAIERAVALFRRLPGAGNDPPAIDEIAHGGSDRRFVRIRGAAVSAVAAIDPPGGGTAGYAAVAAFLRSCGAPAPLIHAVDEEVGLLLMEDLGDRHLDAVLAGEDEAGERRLYERCVDLLVLLQTAVTRRMEKTGFLAGRPFDIDCLLAETDYFRETFVEAYCGASPPPGWEEERRLVAERLAAAPRVFMHRDFQSRNIMLAGGELRLIDLQSAYRGPGLYDAASLLCDPYHPIAGGLRRRLLDRLWEGLRAGGAELPSRAAWEEEFVLAGIQRNEQALAAFARLGAERGKKRFLGSIPAGLASLRAGLAAAGTLPASAALAAKLEEIINGKENRCGGSS